MQRGDAVAGRFLVDERVASVRMIAIALLF